MNRFFSIQLATGALLFLAACSPKEFFFEKTLESMIRVDQAQIVINRDETYTQHERVRLALYGEKAAEMYVTNDPTCNSGGSWQDYQPSVASWLLEDENSSTAVFAKFRSVDGVETNCVSDSIIHDSEGPVVNFTRAPSAWVNSTEEKISVQGQDRLSGVSLYECRWKGQPQWSPCSSAFSVPLPYEGTYQIEVRARDGAGNMGPAVGTNWAVDRTPPQVVLRKMPDKMTGQKQALFAFDVTDNASVDLQEICHVNQQPMVCEKTEQGFDVSSQGMQHFSVYAMDQAGNRSEDVVYEWLVDWEGPIVEWISKPEAYVTSSELEVKFAAKDEFSGVSRFECRHGQGEFQDCQPSLIYNGMKEVVHHLEVKAYDGLGHVSAPLKTSWLVDRTPPSVHWMQTPGWVEESGVSHFQFKVADSGSGVESWKCFVDDQEMACGDEQLLELRGLREGAHRFKVEVRDRAGLVATSEKQWQVHPDLFKQVDEWHVNDYGQVDLVFVVDSSVSMAVERRKMAQRFGNLVAELEGLDWRVAMTTTDVYSNNERSNGRFMKFSKTGSYYLDSSMDPQTAFEAFEHSIRKAKGGDAREKGIRATYLALQNRERYRSNRDFFRDQAHLEVILISDSDNGIDNHYDIPANMTQYIVDEFGRSKSFSFHSIIVEPGDRGCLQTGEEYGHNYSRLSSLSDGVVGSVCAADYNFVVQQIGERIREKQRQKRLACAPYDRNQDQVPDLTIRWQGADPQLTHKIERDVVTFSDFLPLGVHYAEYYCRRRMRP